MLFLCWIIIWEISKDKEGDAMAQVVSHQPLTTKAWVKFEALHVCFVVDELALGQVFLQILRFFRVSIIPLTFHTHSFIPAFIHLLVMHCYVSS
jgi:hypothetical protein